ncbi:MAG: ATP-dependent helicase [Candidatus Limnocylindrales bacterium]
MTSPLALPRTDPVAAPIGAPIDLEVVAELLHGLDRQQRQAVTHADGPLLVLAGPGAGKTHVVTRRIAWLIATKRARPEQILALTFTERAAEEMQARVDLLVPYGQAGTDILTFHAFGDRLIRDHALELGLPGEPRVVSRPEAAILLGGAIDRLALQHYRPLADPTRHVEALVDLAMRAKDEGALPADFRALATTLEATGGSSAASPDTADAAEARDERAARLRELAAAYETYQGLLLETGAIDHGDQLSMAVRLLREHPSVRAVLASRYRYLMVDEFQDTNPAQLDLLDLVGAGTRNVTVVGDDDQAIYAFRGAAVENLLGFEARFSGTRTIALRRNYRSRRPIVDAARRLIQHNDPHRLEARSGVDRTPIVTRRARPKPVIVRTFSTVAEEADWIAAEAASRIKRGAHPRSIAVLVRTNADAEPILRSLNMAGLPWASSGATAFGSRPVVRELMAFVRLVADPTASTDCYAVATASPYGLGGPGMSAILERSRRRRVPLWATCEELVEQPGLVRLDEDARARLVRFVGEMRAAIDQSHRRSAGELLYDHLRRSGRLQQLIDSSADGDGGLEDAAGFFSVVRSAGLLVRDDRLPVLAGHLEALASAGPAHGSTRLETTEAISVLTVHKAKGLEFATVFVPGLADGRFPRRGRREAMELPLELRRSAVGAADEAIDAEERRLCYVAMTRARDELLLTMAASADSGRRRRPSVFLLEALDGPPPEPVQPAAVERLADIAHTAGSVDVQAVSSPGARELPLVLSFSALDTYLACPARYRYRHLLRVPEPAHHALGVGSALHQAVAAFNISRMRGRPLDDAGIVAALDAHWSGEGFLSRDHEEARYAASRSAVLRFRATDLAAGSPPAASVESRFSVAIEGVRVDGRYDRVDVTDEGVVITDYKSSDVRDPARARQRARDSLQLAIYALAHEATEGTPPVAVDLHFLESGVVGRAPIDGQRLDMARSKVRTVARGIGEGDFAPRPDVMTCRTCPFRGICPAALG